MSSSGRFIATVIAMVIAPLAAATVFVATADGARAMSLAGEPTPTCHVNVSEGRVTGHLLGRTCSYRGLRYAAAPTGAQRFRPPGAPPRWRGLLRLPKRANYACPRIEPNVTEAYAGSDPTSTNEDCLRVTVTAPATPGRDRPILVYLHGGGFLSGSGFQSDFDGRRLARRGDAVVVTVNYRLGVLGFLELGDLSSRSAGSGNNGLRDQIAALQWVRRNAGAFGGDPSLITVMGQSAGAISISAMLAGRHPERLFRRAIVQSGNGYLVQTQDQARQNAREILNSAKVTRISQLRSMSVEDLLEMQSEFIKKHPVRRSTLFAPYVDGRLVPANVLKRLAGGSARSVDLLIGTTRDEGMYFALNDPALAYLPALANPFFPSALRSRQVSMVATYGRDLPASGLLPGRKGATIAMLSDQLFRIPAIRMAEAQRRWNRHTYMYRFDWAPQAPTLAPPHMDVGAMHTIELPFVFGALRLGWVPYAAKPDADESRTRRHLASQMAFAWLTFARTGKPNPSTSRGVPRWEPYDARRRYTMLWRGRPTLVVAPGDARRRAWDGYPFSSLDYDLPVG